MNARIAKPVKPQPARATANPKRVRIDAFRAQAAAAKDALAATTRKAHAA